MVKFDIIRGPGSGRLFLVDEDDFTIGRGLLNEITLDDESMSNRHIRITREGDRHVLTDLGSTNGSFVNGRQVKQVRLYSGNEIRIGKTVLRYSDGTPAQKTDSDRVHIVGDTPADIPMQATQSLDYETTLINMTTDMLEPDDLAAAHRSLAALYRIIAVLNSTVSIGDLFDRIVTQIFRVTGAERACVMLIDNDTGGLVEQVVKTRDNAPSGTSIHLSKSVVDRVLGSGKGLLTSNTASESRYVPKQNLLEENIQSAICVPLRVRDDTLGIIYVDNLAGSQPFNRRDLDFLTALGREAGVAVENTMLYEANLKAERLAAVGQTIAGLSHYIKNVLFCMQGGAEVVQRELDKENVDGVRSGWEIVRRNERKMSDLVMNMLSYSKDRKPQCMPCDINAFLTENVELASFIARGRDIEIVLDLEEGIPEIPIERLGIHRCVLNLLTNAVDAIKEPSGRITISTRFDREAGRVSIAVADTGVGVDEDDSERLFDPFTSTKGAGGTGLGLAVVRKVVQEHLGEVTVASGPEGGAVFTIHLPATRPPEADEED